MMFKSWAPDVGQFNEIQYTAVRWVLVGPIPGTEFTEKYLYVCKHGRQYLF